MKLKLSIATASVLMGMSALGVQTQTYNLANGWNLVGSTLDGVNVNSTTFPKVNSIWKYDNGWSASSPNGTLTTNLSKAAIPSLSTLNSGEGFWINSEDVTDATTSGSIDVNETISLKEGWQLLSLKGDSSITVGSVFNDSTKITTVWKYSSGKWQAYSPSKTLSETLDSAGIDLLSDINVGEGFWVNASGETDLLDSPPVVGGIISLEGLETTDTKTNGKVLYSGAAFTGSVQLYSIDDSNYENPLLKEPVLVAADGSYNVTTDDFIDASNASITGSYIIRAVITKAGDTKPMELSAVKTKGAAVEISPITTAVKAKIIETINTFFGGDTGGEVNLSSAILDAVEVLANAIIEQVKEDVQKGDMQFSQNDFVTEKTLEEEQGETSEEQAARIAAQQEQEDKLKAQMDSESSAGAALNTLSNKISEEKEKEIIGGLSADTITSMSNKDFSIDQSVDIATFAYKTISTIAKTGMGVHNGDGRIVVFLPVPSEDFNTLPGEKYSIKVTLDDNTTKSIGDDPALRIVDIASDLKNISGFESWTHNLRDMFDTPIMPYEAIKLMMKHAAQGTTANLLGFGTVFTETNNPMDGGSLFTENPLSVLDGDVVIGAKDIISNYSEDIITNNYDWIFWDYFWHNYDKAMQNGGQSADVLASINSFLDIFGVQTEDISGEVKATLYPRITDETKSDIKDKLFQRLAKLLNATVPYDVNDTAGTLLQFGTDGVTIDSETVIKPMTAFAITNVVMDSVNFNDNMTLVKKTILDAFPFLKDNVDDSILNQEIWFPEYSDPNIQKVLNNVTGEIEYQFNAPSSEEILEHQKFNRDFVLAIISKAIDENLIATDMEGSYSKVMLSLSEVMPKFIEKIETAQFNEQNQGGFDSGMQFDDNGQKETKIKFKVTNNQGQENLKVSSVRFVPMLDDTKNYNWVESNTSVYFVNKTDGYYENNTTLNSWEKLVDIDLTQNTIGQYRQTDMFAVYASEGSDEYFVGHFLIFPIDENNLNELWFDASSFGNDMGMDPMYNGGFHEYKLELIADKAFYPYLNTENGEQVGEDIFEIKSDAIEVPSELFKGTLTDGTIELFTLATNWDENGQVWMSNDFAPKNATQSSIKIGTDINEGGMLLIKIDSPSLHGQTLIATIDYVDNTNNTVKMFVEPVPMFDATMGGGFDYWDINTSVTKLVATIKKNDGTPNLNVNDIGYKTILGCQTATNGYQEYPLETATIDGKDVILAGQMTKQSGGVFEKSGAIIVNPNLMFSYDGINLIPMTDGTGTCNFNGNIKINFNGSKDGEEFSEDFGHFFINKSDENNFGEFWWEKWDDSMNDSGYYPPMNNDPMFPEEEMSTQVKFQVSKWDMTANDGMGDNVVNTAVSQVIITRIGQNTSNYNWEPIEGESVTIDVDTNGYFIGDITLFPESTTYGENNEYKETGNFKFEVVTDNGTFDIGWFPLFAKAENFLEYVYFEDMMYDNYDMLNYWDVESGLYNIGAMGTTSMIKGDLDSMKSFVVFDSHKEYGVISVDGNGKGTWADFEFVGCENNFTSSGTGNFTYTGTNGQYTIYEMEDGQPYQFSSNFMMSHDFNVTIPNGGSIGFTLHQVQESDNMSDTTVTMDTYFEDIAYFEGNTDQIKPFVESMIKTKECSISTDMYNTYIKP